MISIISYKESIIHVGKFSNTELNYCPVVRGSWWLRWYRIYLQFRRPVFDPWVGKSPWKRKWQPTPVFFPGKSHGQRALVGYSPWGYKELDTAEHSTGLERASQVALAV